MVKMASLLSDICLSLLGFVLFISIICTSADDTLQRELLTRIEALEKQGREQAASLLTQAETILQMESKLNIQNAKIVSQQQTISDFKQRVDELERRVEALINAKEHIDADTSYSEDLSGTSRHNHTKDAQQLYTETGIKKVSKRENQLLMERDGPVAFHAILMKGAEVNHIGANQKIVFPDVMINLGGGYHNQHGLFIAPRPGLYLFSTSIMSYAAGHVEIYVHLVKNGNNLANAYAHGDSGRHDQGSVTVVTQLAAGDEVWVSLYGPPDTSLWGDSFDSFMGCLITPM